MKYDHDNSGTIFCNNLAHIFGKDADKHAADILGSELSAQLTEKIKTMKESELSVVIRMMCRIKR
jgi:hypothetical protein